MNESEMYETVKKAAYPEYSVNIDLHSLSECNEELIFVSRIYVKKYSERLGKDMPLLSIYRSLTQGRWSITFGDFNGTKADFEIPECIEQDFIREFIIGADNYYKANQEMVEAKAELNKLVRNPKEYIRNSKLNNIGI